MSDLSKELLVFCQYCGLEYEGIYILRGATKEQEPNYVYGNLEWVRTYICFNCCKQQRRNIVADKVEIKIPKDLYISWLNDELELICDLSLEEVTQRILVLQQLSYEVRTKLGKAFEIREEKLGADFKKRRDELVTEPNFKVTMEGDPRFKTKSDRPKVKVEKKSKADRNADLFGSLGIDMDALTAAIKAKKEEIKK